jgi:hypothetical protein
MTPYRKDPDITGIIKDFHNLPLRETWTGVIVHRIEVSQEDASFGDEPSEIVRFFREHPIGINATGGDMPYPIIIEREGHITQTMPLNRISPHARSHNPTTIGVALVGDFRHQNVPLAQYESLISVCVNLLSHLQLGSSNIHGHDELSAASHDPDKICPGKYLDMNQLRAHVDTNLQQHNTELTELLWQ